MQRSKQFQFVVIKILNFFDIQVSMQSSSLNDIRY